MLFALIFMGWSANVQHRRNAAITALPGWSTPQLEPDPASLTGYADGRRQLLVPGRNPDSYQWLLQCEQARASDQWRIRHVDHDNAPYGRETHFAAPYRLWLNLLASLSAGSRAIPQTSATEWAARWAGPSFHALGLVTCGLLAAHLLGARGAIVVVWGLVALFPLASSFQPDAPDHHGPAWLCALGSLLPLARPRHLGHWVFAGAAGGFGLWISATTQGPLLVGVLLGAAAGRIAPRPFFNASVVGATRVGGDGGTEIPAGWRVWSLAGGTVSLCGYLAEYFPHHLGWRLEGNHPLYALAWWGAGELLTRTSPSREKRSSTGSFQPSLILAIVALGGAPVALLAQGSPGWFAGEWSSTRLSFVPENLAPDTLAWIGAMGFTPVVLATLAPLLLALPALGRCCGGQLSASERNAVFVLAGALGVALGLAIFRLRWWQGVDVALLPLLAWIAVAPADGARARRARLAWTLGGLVATATGLLVLWPPREMQIAASLDRGEIEALAERDVAHWLSLRAGPDGATVLAPPNLSMSLAYHGGLRVLGTIADENRDGLAAAVRLASATSQEEAFALVEKRGVDFIIIPSWDGFLDDYVRLGAGGADSAFVTALHRWALPPWLRPIPYRLPEIPGFEGQTVAVFAVVEEQEPVAAFARLAEYFVEMRQRELAAATRDGLRRFPGDPEALTALAQVELLLGEAGDFNQVFGEVLASLEGTKQRLLSWDRRASLALVLAHGRRLDLARVQLERCLKEMDEARLRSLSPESLYRLQRLARRFDKPFGDARLQSLGRTLLSPALQARLDQS